MRILVAALAVAVAACAPTTAVTTTTTPAAATTTSTAPDASPPCLSGDLSFGEAGVIAALGQDTGDATTLAGVRWEGHDGCERIVLDFFGEGGSPASSIGPSGAIALAESGILRITLPGEIAGSALADSILGGALAERAFVSRDTTGALFVDVHLSAEVPVEVRAFEVPSPVRIVVDLRQASGPALVIAAPSVAGGTVLVAPAPGAALYPLRVTGYARPDAEAVRVRISGNGEVGLERAVSTMGPRDTWHAFDVRLADGPSGPVEMYVGPVDAFDEPLDGVTVPLELP